MRIFKKILKIIFLIIIITLALAFLLLIYFNIPVSGENDSAQLGVTFSSRYAADIGLDWKEAYIAMLDDLKIRKIRIPVYWDLAEKEEGQYDYSDIDWQLEEAKKRNAEIILVVGQKVPRWPECAIPGWANTSDEKRKASLLQFVAHTLKRYKNEPEIKYWQIENEPFLKFGVCPTIDPSLLDSEIALAKAEDSSRPIVITDSGELSFWVQAASRADIFGTTMYRTIYKQGWGYYEYPIGPRFFQFKYWLNKVFAHQNNAVVIELQAEPWISGYTTNEPLEEQFKSMNPEQLKSNVTYARKVGFPSIYLWGVEWWYWLKVEKSHPELWETARTLFSQNQEEKTNASLEEKPITNVSSQIVSLNIPDKIKIDVPFSSQAPLGNWDAFHEEACEEMSLIMVKYYLDHKKLTPDLAEKEIQGMIKFENDKYGDYKDSNASQIIKLAHDYYGINNMKAVYNFTRQDLKKYLALGKPIIVPAAGRDLGNPYFTQPGPLYHNLVILGYDGDNIITNDPGTKRGEGYAYNINVLYNAIHDFPGKPEDIEKGEKAMIVLE